jgi:galactose-1-phosphate uridylyltransferase
MDLSNIYLEEALVFLRTSTEEDKLVLEQRCELLKTQESLVLKNPRKVIRQLKKIDAEDLENANEAFIAFLYYTAYMSLGDAEKAEVWKSKISLVNLRKAEMLINLNS